MLHVPKPTCFFKPLSWRPLIYPAGFLTRGHEVLTGAVFNLVNGDQHEVERESHFLCPAKSTAVATNRAVGAPGIFYVLGPLGAAAVCLSPLGGLKGSHQRLQQKYIRKIKQKYKNKIVPKSSVVNPSIFSPYFTREIARPRHVR